MEFLIITGPSGGGKSRTADVLEDLDYYCVDNMPTALLPRFAEFCMATGGRYERVSLVIDIRDRGGADEMFDSLNKLWELGCDYRILYVEADKETIIKRYKESRRPHPLLSEAGSISGAIDTERERLSILRESADFVINTSSFTIAMLQSEIYRLFVGEASSRLISVNVISFGFKYGVPIEADMMFDVRFLPNPYYISALRPQTGTDKEVYDFVHSHETTKEFMRRLQELVSFLIPQYIEEGKRNLTIAVGCTGGHHRSVAVAEALSGYIKTIGQASECLHRDKNK